MNSELCDFDVEQDVRIYDQWFREKVTRGLVLADDSNTRWFSSEQVLRNVMFRI
jgi:hypothetical protein